MLVERYMLERWLPEDVVHMMLSTDTELSQKVLNQPCDWQNKIINCRIVQYSRIRPDGTLAENYERVRLVAPSDPDNPKMNLDWQPIVKIEHYRLNVDSLKHPVVLRQDTAQYKLDDNKH